MQLQDFENEILSILQQSAMLNFGGAPLWTAGLTGNQVGQFPQTLVDYQINRGYKRVMMDFADTEVALYTCQTLSVANALNYPLPPPGPAQALIWNVGEWNFGEWGPAPNTPNPPLHLLMRVFYAPQGLQYNLEMEPGIRMIPWKEFQRYTDAGYLASYSFGPQPEVCSVAPDRKTIWFYPGTASAGDTITYQYAPIPTKGTTVPILVAEADTPLLLPDDIQELIVYYAAEKLLPRARDFDGADEYRQLRISETSRMRQLYLRKSQGDKKRFTDAAMDRASSGPYNWMM